MSSAESAPRKEGEFTMRLTSSALINIGRELVAPDSISLNFVGFAIIVKSRLRVLRSYVESTQNCSA
jgi:hypothetical protein